MGGRKRRAFPTQDDPLTKAMRSSSLATDLQLDAEFRLLKSLIPGIAGKEGVSEVSH
jgi:hypothetical protein